MSKDRGITPAVLVNALPGLFVVGTDTGVGKTRVAASIARRLVRDGHRVGVFKPVATGVLPGTGRGEDAAVLAAAAGGSMPLERVVPLVYEAPLAPVVAARRLGERLEAADVERAVDLGLKWWLDRAELMVVEGIGGFLTPVAEGMTVADLAIRLDYPLVVVARRALGTLNHTLLTVEAALRRGLRIAGIVLNGAAPAADAQAALAEATNAGELARHLGSIAVLAEVPFSGREPDLGDEGAAGGDDVLGRIDWLQRAQRPRWGAGDGRTVARKEIEPR
jgi:dethiobiotin synthetase